MHPSFAFDDCWRKSTQDVEPEVGFDLTVVQLDLPALDVEWCDGFVRKPGSVEQRGNDTEAARVKTTAGNRDADRAQRERLWKPSPKPS